MQKKYELTENKKLYNLKTLYQIRALKDFFDVKKGDLGGWVESESNLSQEGECWIYNDAMVFDYAVIYDNAKVFNSARIYDNAKVYGVAKVFGCARIYGAAKVYDRAIVAGDTQIFNRAEIFGCAKIFDNAEIYGVAKVYDRAQVFDNAEVFGSAKIFNNNIFGYSRIFDTLYNDSEDCYIYMGPIGSRYDTTTAFINKDKEIMVVSGCFKGTLKEFKKAVKEDHGDNKYAKQYKRFIKCAKKHFKDILEEDNNEE